ncbi:F-box/LRR-repeat protein 4-like [Haliotis cracherodii]|uniref:F-box/LRR-repeat protein 4-like n=1 Tax=Haliotis cracherodii TaxID=6455 RepID=UPI0039ED180C
MRLTIGLHTSGYVQPGAAKSFVNAESKLDCIAFCYFKGVKIAMTYDPSTLKCTCYNVLLSTGTAAPGAVAYELTGEPNLIADTVDTWISSLIRESSVYSFTAYDYSGHNVIGAPDYYPSYGNTDLAWCPYYLDADQFIELGIPEAIYITEIHIYEVFWAGAVEAVSIRDSNSNWVPVWSTPAVSVIEESRIFVPSFVPPPFKSDAIRLDLDLATINNWSEFDAVRVIGTRSRWII